ncbi:hypothetical protein Zmor_026554 [Zophobas morio]|uniref:Uncharacterized protein n=1 Tax=Zophobas morio TaxID=2755281 RepID=A0AA38HTX3_9CUCU|nr:hypothetical protein Zmor_026554 [Zophobas morio]
MFEFRRNIVKSAAPSFYSVIAFLHPYLSGVSHPIHSVSRRVDGRCITVWMPPVGCCHGDYDPVRPFRPLARCTAFRFAIDRIMSGRVWGLFL